MKRKPNLSYMDSPETHETDRYGWHEREATTRFGIVVSVKTQAPNRSR